MVYMRRINHASTTVNACGRLIRVINTAGPRHPLPVITQPAVCCSPLIGRILDGAAAERLASALKALAEPTRLRLISLVAAHDGAEACVCDLTDPVGLSQPTVSHHMKVLVGAGLLEREQRGKWAYYRLVPGALNALADQLATGIGR
jgi:ArsR family transcriptional regulator